MRFLHTADWHLGRVLHGVPLIEDQRHVLEQIIAIAREERPDFVVVAGDVYDRTVPPPEAVDLLGDTLERLALDLNLPTFLIAGNHDCPRRLGFGARLLGRSGVRLAGVLTAACCDTPVAFQSASGETLDIYLLPYAEPAACREQLVDDTIRCHDSAMCAATARMTAGRSGRRRLLVGHVFADGGAPSDSERPLTLGGAGTVSATHFAGFDYVALGHLHRPQRVGEVARYAGSILKYSFSESDDRKSVTMVELSMDGNSPAVCRQIPLAPNREMSVLTGTFQELCERGAADCPERGHYLSVELTDDVMVLDARGRLEEWFPHILHLDRRALRSAATRTDEAAVVQPDLRCVGPGDVFRAFFRDVKGADLTGEQLGAFAEIFTALPADQREIVA